MVDISYFSPYSTFSDESIHIPRSVTEIGGVSWIFNDYTSLKIVYLPSSAFDSIYELFCGSDQNDHLTILSQLDEYHNIIMNEDEDIEIEGHPCTTLNNIQQCIDHLPNNIPSNQQLHALHLTLQQQFPCIAQRAQLSSLNLLHLLVYFPGDIYQPLSTLLEKCPQAASAIDSSGRTPLHHVMISMRLYVDVNCYELLLRESPENVVYLAIKTVAQSNCIDNYCYY